MEKEKKFTKMENLEDLKEIVTTLLEEGERQRRLEKFINHEEELLLNKARKTKKASDKDEEIKQLILAEMERIGTPVTVTDLLETDAIASFIVAPATETEKAKKLSSQKVSAMLTKMKDVYVKRVVEKKKSYFSLIDNAE